jgi:hypothetical protein
MWNKCYTITNIKLNLSFIERLVWNVIVSGCFAGFLVSMEMVLNFIYSGTHGQELWNRLKVTKLENQTRVY